MKLRASVAAAAAVAAAIAACSTSSPPPVAEPTSSAPIAAAPVASTPPLAPAPPAPAAPVVPEAVTAAPAWIFRYHTADRSETWTLRTAEGSALLVVDAAGRETRYTGTATSAGSGSLAIAVATPTAKLALDCKPTRRALGAHCNDAKAPPIDVLDCYVPAFATPMPFAPAPGVEYVVDAGCNGYRLAAP